MSPPREDELTAIELSGTHYTVEQTGRDGNFRPEYEAKDVTGETLFRTTYRMYEEKDAFPFVDADGTEICRVTAIDTWDIAGDYLLTDSRTETDLVRLDNDLSLLGDTWRIRDADDRSLLAKINSRSALITLSRKLLPFDGWIPHEYEVTDEAGDPVGSIEGEFAPFDRDRYEIDLTDTSSVPTEPIVIGAIVIDAIQGS